MNTILKKRNFTIENIKEEVTECLTKLKNIGLISEKERNINNYCFALNNRAINILGKCTTILPNQKYCISINNLYAQYGELEKVKQTIMHEVLHSLPNGYGHKGKWAYYANIVNLSFSEYHIERTSHSDNYEKAIKELRKPKYTIICPFCQTQWEHQRKTKLIQLILSKQADNKFICPICKNLVRGWKLKIKNKEMM